jgi:hypothetical protein
MSCKRCLVLAGLALLALPWGTAQAGGPRIGVGVYVGGPYYYGPYWGGYYYYRPVVPVYVAPPPVVVQPGPIVTTTPLPPGSSVYPQPQADLPPPRILETRGDEIDRLLGQLGNPDDAVRADVAIRLGRMRARRAAEPLEHLLASDRSADVRDAAARALGLIGMQASLPALQRAAQSDDDRGVRSSSQFAVDVIRSR